MHHHLSSRVLGLMGLALLTPTIGAAVTLKVPEDHATIQAAVDAAFDGDRIAVAKGTYDPFVVDGKANLTIKGKPVVDGEGIDVEGSDNLILSNTVKNAGSNGMELGELGEPGEAMGNLFERNKATGAADNGYLVRDTGNTFRRNKAAKSGGFGLLGETGPGSNLYEGNRFGSEEFL